MDAQMCRALFPETDGVFTPLMARAAGLSVRDVSRLRSSGAVVRVCGMALVSATTTITPRRRAIGAALTWPDSIVCLRTAALLHRLRIDDDDLTHVLVPNGRRATKGLVPHNWSVRPTAVERRGPLIVTDRRTTLADCLGRMPEAEAWGLLAWHWTRDEIDEADLASQLAERRHLYGVVRLRSMLSAVRQGALSVGEIHFHQFLDDWHIQGWEPDQKILVGGRIVARVDTLFRELRLIIEFDGALAHADAAADEARDTMLRALGYTVLHVRWPELHDHPARLARRIRASIAAAATRRLAS